MPTNVDTLQLTGMANLTATGNGDSHTLIANAGDDTLIAGTGVATLIGGVGNDTFVVNNSADVIQVGTTHGNDTVQSSVNYVLPANVNTLILTGNANLTGQGNSADDLIIGNAGNDTLTAGSGNDTLMAGTGLATLIGGAGNDTFVVNNVNDVVQDSYTSGNNIIQSSVNYVLPTNVNTLILTGTANLTGQGNSANDLIVGNAGNDTLTAGAGNDTLVAGTGSISTTLIGGAGNDTFVINNTHDVVQDSYTSGNNILQSSVSYVLPTNINTLILTGTADVTGTGNSASDVITANSGNDTLIAGSGVATLIGGAGSDTFVINNASDVVQDSYTGGNNILQSSVSYVLPTNVNTLILTGTANLSGTGNDGIDVLIANTGNDTLTASRGGAALIGGSGSDTLTGGAYRDFFASGKKTNQLTSQTVTTVTTGATANVVAMNANDGSLTINATAGASNVLSLGGGIDTEGLTFKKMLNTSASFDLVLSDSQGDAITFQNWYSNTNNHDVVTLQVMESMSASYSASSSDGLRNAKVEDFDFSKLVAAFDQAVAANPLVMLTGWSLTGALPGAQTAASNTAAIGGDLAYDYALNDHLTSIGTTAAQATLSSTKFGVAAQNVSAWQSGG